MPSGSYANICSIQVPWKPGYTEAEARDAIDDATTWKQALEELGLRGSHGKNIATLRAWAARWGISTSHLSDRRGSKPTRVSYTEEQAREAIAGSLSWSESLRKLGYCPTGGNPPLLKRRAAEWGISTAHFDPYAAARRRRPRRSLEEILVSDSTYARGHLKRRLYEAGLKERRCESCGQGEMWQGQRISLILDHINGQRNDNRIENLQIVCPNCAASLETHCGRQNVSEPRKCAQCQEVFHPRYRTHRFCSPGCSHAHRREVGSGLGGMPQPDRRKVERPSHDELLAAINERGYLAVAREHGVSDNAVRKWARMYEREKAIREGRDPNVVEIPTRTWPNRKRAAY